MLRSLHHFSFIPDTLHLKISQNIREILIFCWVIGIFLTFIVPPFQKPDESDHFFRAISVAQGNLICSANKQGVFQNSIPAYLHNFPIQMYEKHIAANPRAAFSKQLYIDTAVDDTFSYNLVNEPASCSLPFVLYMHLGVILSLPVFLQANPLFIFYLGRTINFVISFALFVFAIKKTPDKLRSIPLLMLLLPMTLHQMGSYSKDALHLAAGAIVIAYILKKIHQSIPFNRRDYLIFFLSLSITILSRPYFIGLSLLTLFIMPVPLIKSKSLRSIAFLSFPLLITLLIAWLISENIYVTPSLSKGISLDNSPIMPGMQFQFIQEFPLQFIHVLYQTTEKELWFILTSLIGKFGWLDYTLQWYLYICYMGIIFYIFYQEKKFLPFITKKQLVLLWGSITLCLMGSAVAFYLYASPVASGTVLGLQGRYFIILLPLLIISILELWKMLGMLFTRSVFGLIGLAIFSSVILRYYDYSYHYYREIPSEVQELIKNDVQIAPFMEGKLSLALERKLTGITVFVSNSQTVATAAYKVTVFDSACQKQLQTKIFPAKIFAVNGPLDLIFPVIDTNQFPEVCVHIEAYVPSGNSYAPLILEAENITGTAILTPVYLY